MVSFNAMQKKRRAVVAAKKRDVYGDPHTKKLKRRVQLHSVSGKRKQKLLKKLRREQKDAVEKGLVTMEDVQMAAAADGSSQESKKGRTKFPMKRAVKLKSKHSKNKGNKKQTTATQGPSVDVMLE